MGFFIALEGCDGAGKSTIVRMLNEYLLNKKLKVLATKEPGGSEICKQIRSVIVDKNNTKMDANTELLLYAADRAQHLSEIIEPALKDGYIVICDRYIDSNLAYQGVARGLGIDKIMDINKFINYRVPDLTIFLDIKPEIGLFRINKDKSREVNRLDLETLDFHNKVYNGYQKLIQDNPNRIISINANRKSEEILKDIITIVEKKIKELN